MNALDRFLNNITMYRLVMDYLIVLLAVAAVFGAVGILPYSPIATVFSALFLLVVCWGANRMFAAIFKAQTNAESAYITALILALIITPGMPTDVSTIIFMAWAGVFAMASKYLLAINKKHIFNPAAFGVAATLLLFGQSASWWVGGNLPLLPFVLGGALLFLRKVQRIDLSGSFILAALASCVLTHLSYDPVATIEKTLLHTPLIFFSAVMITEPLTTPPTRGKRIAYGLFVGALFSPAIVVAGMPSTPELALCAGNILSYILSPKGKQMLTLSKKEKVGDDIWHFTFVQEKKLAFQPGQYMEWTLGHTKPDKRGNRRYFTVASAPTESTLQLGVKFYEPSSSFKKALGAMAPGDTILAGQLAGDFTLPRDPSRKLAFIAGGIGITPFRSMIKDLFDRGERRDIVLFYSNRTEREIAYRDVFDEAARKIGMRTIYVTTDGGARLSADMLMREMPDWRERTFYLSGPHAMTNAFTATLRGMGVPHSRIKTDFFPGFA